VPAAALLLALTRPEGNLAAALVLLVVAWHLEPRERRALARWTVLLYALPFGAYWALRWWYYGLPFPLPFYVKLSMPGAWPGVPDVLAWLARHAVHAGVLVLIALAPPPRALRPALFATLALILFFLLPQHLMGYQSRYLAPLDGLVCALAAVGLARMRFALVARTPGAFASAAALTALLAIAAWQCAGLPEVFADRLAYADGLAAAHETLGRELAARRKPRATLALSDGGAVPYLSHWWTLDLIGLDDREFAVTHRREPQRLLALAPDVVVLVSRARDAFAPWDWNAYEAAYLPALMAHGYRHTSTRRFADDYWLWVLERP
jgi:arabinofuranosyltransferase